MDGMAWIAIKPKKVPPRTARDEDRFIPKTPRCQRFFDVFSPGNCKSGSLCDKMSPLELLKDA
jgi:hypothetical protein